MASHALIDGVFRLRQSAAKPSGNRGSEEFWNFKGTAVLRRAAYGEHSLGSGIATDNSRSACCWDGRLDNKAELRRSLGLDDEPNDATTALSAWRKFGDAGLGKLIGDWSLALWDEPGQTLILASDFAGVRPLYYRIDSERVAWSSSLEDLNRDFDPGLSDDYAAAFLGGGMVGHLTPYRGIFSIPPGTALRVTGSTHLLRPFYDLAGVGETRYPNDADYEQRALELFREAVQCRMDGGGAVFAELSGGLDSSSVACAASEVFRQRGGDSRQLVTLTYDERGSTDDPFCRLIERTHQPRAIHFPADAVPPVSAAFPGEAAPRLWCERFHTVSRLMAQLNARTLLTGQLGDLVMANWSDDSEQAADLLRSGDVIGGIREALAWSRSLRSPVWPLLGRSINGALGRDRHSMESTAFPGSLGIDQSLTPLLMKKISPVAERADWAQLPPSRRKRLAGLTQMLRSRRLECPAELCHVSWTHPFLHRPLVEFMTSIPAGVTCRPGEPRRLMRRAFAPILPSAVAQRRSKGSYEGVLAQALRPAAAELLNEPRPLQIAERGWVDPTHFQMRLRRFLLGAPCLESQLRSLILFELWLRRLEGNQQVFSTQPA